MYQTHHKSNNKSLFQYLFLSVFTAGILTGFVFLFQNYHFPTTKAHDKVITFKIKLQGESYPQTTIKTNIIFYKSQGKVAEFPNVYFTYHADKTFEGSVFLDTYFDYNSLYAVYIKPEKYFGRLFCSENIYGKNCTSPQFIFKPSGDIINLSTNFFSGGDIEPLNGRVDAYDISRIISNLGKSTDVATDINSDSITNTLDYLLALYSLDKNLYDDNFSLVVPWAPASTSTPIPTPFASPTFPFPNITYPPTNIPQPTRRPTYTPTHTPIPLQTGVCVLIPGPYAKNTCGLKRWNIISSSVFSICRNSYAFKPNCGVLPLKSKCTCPDGALCICQLNNQADQTVNCTQGGKIEIVQCE